MSRRRKTPSAPLRFASGPAAERKAASGRFLSCVSIAKSHALSGGVSRGGERRPALRTACWAGRRQRGGLAYILKLAAAMYALMPQICCAGASQQLASSNASAETTKVQGRGTSSPSYFSFVVTERPADKNSDASPHAAATCQGGDRAQRGSHKARLSRRACNSRVYP